jgi:hypothetical protein
MGSDLAGQDAGKGDLSQARAVGAFDLFDQT